MTYLGQPIIKTGESDPAVLLYVAAKVLFAASLSLCRFLRKQSKCLNEGQIEAGKHKLRNDMNSVVGNLFPIPKSNN